MSTEPLSGGVPSAHVGDEKRQLGPCVNPDCDADGECTCPHVEAGELMAIEHLTAELATERAKVERVEALCDEYRTNCDPDTKQAQVAEIFHAALTEGDDA